MNRLIRLYKSRLANRLLTAVVLAALLMSAAAAKTASAALWAEEFDSNLPAGWVRGSNAAQMPEPSNPMSWSINGNSYQNSAHPTTVHFSMMSVAGSIWLDSPMIQIPTQGANLKYNHSMLVSATLDLGAKLFYTLDGISWTQLESYATWDRDYVCNPQCDTVYYWNSHTVSLPSSTYGKQAAFRWMFFNNSSYMYSMDYWIDNVALAGLGDSESFNVSTPGEISDPMFNEPFSFNKQMTVSGGIPPYTASVIPPDPIPGLTFNIDSQYNFTITGTPTTVGIYDFAVQVQDSYQFPQTRKFLYTLYVQDGTTTTVSVSADQPTEGPYRTFTATAKRNSDQAGLPLTQTDDFNVAFLAEGKVLPDCAHVGLFTSSNGVATCITKYLADGDHQITATFAGSRLYNASTSDPVSYTQSCTPTNLTVTSNDSLDSTFGSLPNVVNRSCVGGTITFDNDYTIQLGWPLYLDRDVTIDGGTHAITVKGGLKAFIVYPETTVSLKNMTVQNGTIRQWYRDWYTDVKSGCAIDNRGTLTAVGMNFTDGVNVYDPDNIYDCGMVYNDTLGQMTVTNSTFTGNTAYSAIRNLGTLTVTGSTFSGNDALKETDADDHQTHGGAIHNSGVLQVSGSTFSNNNDDLKVANVMLYTAGGAIYSDRLGSLTITGSTFTGNYAPYFGGAVGIAGETFTVSDSVFTDNSDGGYGGGAIMAFGYGSVQNSTFSGNTAASSGGAITGVKSIRNNTFYANSASAGGGAIHGYVTPDFAPDIINNTFVGNTSTNGAGTIDLLLVGSDPLPAVSLYNNLLVKGTTGVNCQFPTGVNILAGNNLTDDDSCGTTGFIQLTADQMMLGTLSNNGGPTETIPLLAGSPAIDAGDDTACSTTDQRGFARFGICDIGSFEVQPPISAPAITSHPQNQSVVVEDTASFSTAASGNPTPTVQWQVLSTASGATWTDIDGASTGTLTITGVTYAQNGYKYRAVFTNSQGSATTNEAVLTVSKKTAICSITGWNGTYDGQPHGASGTCTGSDGTALAGLSLGAAYTNYPGGMAYWTFSGGSDYTDQSGWVDINIRKASAYIFISGLSQTYTGSAINVTTVTQPSGLSVRVTYDGSSTPPVNVGSYIVTATIDNANYSGYASNLLEIVKATAAVTLSNLSQTADGSPKPVTVTTVPSGLSVDVTYDGSTTAPSVAGSYAVIATVNDRNYQGTASGTLTISNPTTQPYTSAGFSAPLDLGGVLNQAKAGQMIPLKWRLLDSSGNPVTSLDPASVILTVNEYSCSANAPVDAIETYATGTTTLQNLGNGYYQLNWKTDKTWANSCKKLTLKIGTWTGDGLTALFQFKK